VVGGLDPIQGSPNQLVPASSTLIWAASKSQPTHSHSQLHSCKCTTN